MLANCLELEPQNFNYVFSLVVTMKISLKQIILLFISECIKLQEWKD